jgi:hypothetical protein
MYTIAGQKQSALRRAVELQMTHGGRYEIETIVGVTPPERRGHPAVVHFCSSRLRLVSVHAKGDGGAIPVGNQAYDVVFVNGLLMVERPAIIKFGGLWTPNGRMSIQLAPTTGLAVWVPRKLLDRCPWAYEGGAEEVAEVVVGRPDLHRLFNSGCVTEVHPAMSA